MSARRSITHRVCALLLAIAGCAEPGFVATEDQLEAPPVDSTSPISALPREPPRIDPARVALGRQLYFDPILSPDGSAACASCHDLSRAGTDGRRTSELAGRPVGGINVPTVYNLAYVSRFTWSGRFDSIEGPLTLAMTLPATLAGTWESAVERLAASPQYRAAFERTYGEPPNGELLQDALASFVFSLTSPDAPFDRYLRGDADAISAEAIEGYRHFRELGCVSCHQGVNIGGNMYQRFGVLQDYFAGRSSITNADLGLYIGTQREEDRHVFRVPSLRNVALTPPYFHDGSAATLEEAVTTMARYQLGRTLEPEQVTSLVAFLRSLTGRVDPVGASFSR